MQSYQREWYAEYETGIPDILMEKKSLIDVHKNHVK